MRNLFNVECGTYLMRNAKPGGGQNNAECFLTECQNDKILLRKIVLPYP